MSDNNHEPIAHEPEEHILVPLFAVPLECDMAELSKRWHANGWIHRIVEEASGKQILYALKKDQSILTQEFVAYQRGQLDLSNLGSAMSPAKQRVSHQAVLSRLQGMFSQNPVTLIMIALSIVGFLLIQFELTFLSEWLFFQTLDHQQLTQHLMLAKPISINDYLAHGQYWRLITPIFLHFGWMHIVFNMLWFWELARRIETENGSLHLLMVILFVGIASNLYQSYSTPYSLFGGMSGVIYGLLAYSGIFAWLVPQKNFHIPSVVYYFMLGSLVAGYLGVFDFIAPVANTAHLFGLIFGLIIAIPTALLYRLR